MALLSASPVAPVNLAAQPPPVPPVAKPTPVSPAVAPTAPTLAGFTAPDPTNFTQDPSYKFTLANGLQALQNSAAARGTLLTGDTAKGITDYGQQSALKGYQQAYNNALNTYTTNRDTTQAGFGDAMSTFNGNLGATGQAQNFNLASSGQALAAQGQAFNEGQTQYANQVGADQTQYDRARQAWVDAGGTGPLYGGYAQPGAPANPAAPPMSLASAAPVRYGAPSNAQRPMVGLGRSYA